MWGFAIMGNNDNKDINSDELNTNESGAPNFTMETFSIDDILNTKEKYISDSEKAEMERQIMAFDPMKKKLETENLRKGVDSSKKSAAEKSMERQILDFDPTKLQEKEEVDLGMRKKAPKKESFTEVLANYNKKKDINDRESMSNLSEKEFSKAQLQGEFWKAEYKETTEAEKKSYKAIKIIIGLIFFAVVVFGIVAFIQSRGGSEVIDLTDYADWSEADLVNEFGFNLTDNKAYAVKTGLEPEVDVTTNVDHGFAVVYVSGKQEGIFFDSDDYSLYGLRVGDPCDNKFENIKYKYTDIKEKTMGRMTRTKTDYILYNSNTGDCVYVSIDDNTGKIKELGYYSHYKKVID